MSLTGTEEGCVKCHRWWCSDCFVEEQFCLEDVKRFVPSTCKRPRFTALPAPAPAPAPVPAEPLSPLLPVVASTNVTMMDTGPLENPESPASTTTTDSDASYSDLSSVASPTGSGSMDVDTPITTISSPGSGSQAGEEEEVEEVGRNLIGELLARTLPPLDDPLGANRLLDDLLSRWHQWRQSPTGQTSQQAGNQSEASSSIGNTAGGYSVSQNPPPSGQRGGEGGASKEAEAEDSLSPRLTPKHPDDDNDQCKSSLRVRTGKKTAKSGETVSGTNLRESNMSRTTSRESTPRYATATDAVLNSKANPGWRRTVAAVSHLSATREALRVGGFPKRKRGRSPKDPTQNTPRKNSGMPSGMSSSHQIENPTRRLLTRPSPKT